MKNQGLTAPMYVGAPLSVLSPFMPSTYCSSVSVAPTNWLSACVTCPTTDAAVDNRLAPTELATELPCDVVSEMGQPELNCGGARCSASRLGAE